MSDFWGKRWTGSVIKHTKNLFKRKEQSNKQIKENASERSFSSWVREKRKPIIGTLSTIAGIGGIVTMVYFGNSLGNEYVEMNSNEIVHVYIGGENVGTVSDETVVEQFLQSKEDLIDELFPNVHMDLKYDPITYQSERGFNLESDDENTLKALEKHLSTRTTGTEVWVDGEMVGIVRDESDAEELLEQYKAKFIQPATKDKKVQVLSADGTNATSGEQTELEKVEFLEAIEFKTVETRPENISTKVSLLHKLEAGDTVPFKYTVQSGDCISCIAAKFDLTTDFIFQNNPQLKGDLIRIGDQLDLTVEKPGLNVQTVEKLVKVEDAPFAVIYQDDPEMRKGLQEVLQQGKTGKKRVEYNLTKVNGILMSREAVNEEILEAPQPKIVKRGTKIIKGVGTGEFSWPVSSPRITSEYGARWGSTHKGTDMVSKNYTIKAADSGTVELAGWYSGYGNAVIINHKNGYKTLYGHMSKITVKKGEKVEKGDKIGVMGNTGNSFGIHLHFEIHKNGKHVDPEDYL